MLLWPLVLLVKMKMSLWKLVVQVPQPIELGSNLVVFCCLYCYTIMLVRKLWIWIWSECIQAIVRRTSFKTFTTQRNTGYQQSLVFAGCVIQLHALHVLVCKPDSILGLSAEACMEKFCAAMKKQIVIPPLKDEQVIEIVQLSKRINDEIESDNIGAAGEDAVDPFNTESNILAAAEAAGTMTVTTGATATATTGATVTAT
jgi:hypothetical protein